MATDEVGVGSSIQKCCAGSNCPLNYIDLPCYSGICLPRLCQVAQIYMPAYNILLNLSNVCSAVKALDSLEKGDLHGMHVSEGKYAATIGADVNKVDGRHERVNSI